MQLNSETLGHWLTPWEQEHAIEAMLQYNILKWSNARDLPLKSGGMTDIYVNLRQARNDPAAVQYFSDMFCNPLRRLGVDRFAEVPQAVSCFAGPMAIELGMPMVTIRDQPKEGRVNAADIVGEMNYGELIGLFDDVITDGASKIDGYHAITRRGARPFLVVGVDRMQGWQQTFQKHGIDMPLWSGMTLHHIRASLIRRGLLERCKPEIEAKNPIILALDGKPWDQILPVIDQLRTTGTILKVNDLVFNEGIKRLVPDLQVYGRVMVDLKAHDIPNTVTNTCKHIAPHNPWAVTVHGSGGTEMVKAAVKELKGTDTIVLFITLLTSIKDESEEIYGRQPIEQVKAIAQLAWKAGARGFVCSPEEAPVLREIFPRAVLVTPGVRSKGAVTNDQQRVATPKEAIDGGADHIVGGRQFFAAPDPVAEVRRVLHDELHVDMAA